MSKKMIGLGVALLVGASIAEAKASSGCRGAYSTAVYNDQWATGTQITAMSTGWFLPIGLYSTTDGVIKTLKYKPVLELIDQAYLGNGIDLVVFTSDLKKRPSLEQITVAQVAQTIVRADEGFYLCPENNLMGKGSLEDLIASMIM